MERFGEPESWWLNQHQVLTSAAAEANGNLAPVRRESGRLLLFAPDHAFDCVTPLPDCPPFSLLTIDDVPDFATWIEVGAGAPLKQALLPTSW